MPELTNPRSDRVKAVRALSGRSSRNRHRQFLVEGPQGVREAVLFAAQAIRDIYVTEPALERYTEIFAQARSRNVYVHTVSEEVMREMSQDSQGMVAVMHMNSMAVSDLDLHAMRNIAVMCDVRDPGNAGTIIRAADAAGADLVILAGQSVDIHNPKVVRSTAGSMFHLPVISGVELEEIAGKLREHGIQIFAAAGQGEHDLDDLLDRSSSQTSAEDVPPSAPDISAPTAWLFGNEARGLSTHEIALSDYGVRVPIRGKAESLNVATAATVCLYATSRAQR